MKMKGKEPKAVMVAMAAKAPKATSATSARMGGSVKKASPMKARMGKMKGC